MNREILFRGKCIEDSCKERGKWVYGYLVYCHEEYELDKPRVAEIIETDAARLYAGEYNYWCAHEVDPETVRQYVGYNDKNGNKIFEGDIVTASWGYRGVVEFDSFIYAEMESTISDDIEVIGNVWDNPEMLEKGEK